MHAYIITQWRANRKKPRMEMRGPHFYRAANPRRLLFDSRRDYRTRNKYNGEVSLRD
jgi:hypothetical protein